MRVILNLSQIEEIKEYLKFGRIPTRINRSYQSNFIKKALKYHILNDMLYLNCGENDLEVIADDDIGKLDSVLSFLHLPSHTGMKAMYMNSKRLYSGFKRDRIDSYVRNCEICAKFQH